MTMASNNNKPGLFTGIPLYRDSYNVALNLFNLTTRFSKQFKYTLGKRLIDYSLDMIDLIYKFNSIGDIKEKMTYIERFINSHELLKVHLRLSEELGAIHRSQLTNIHLCLDDIGKQIHGLKNYFIKNG